MQDMTIISKIINGDYIDPDQVSREDLEELLRSIIYHDAVTGVYNRTGMDAFVKKIDQENRGRDFVTFFANIRSMRLHNVKWTEHGGNQILRGVAQAMASYVGEDGAVCRVGGDNFFIFARKELKDGFINMVSNLVVDIRLGQEIFSTRIGVRMGVSSNDDCNLYESRDRASIALQFIRTSSDKMVIEFVPHMTVIDHNSKNIKDSLESAIKTGEFEVRYQPKVSLKTGALCGAEALCRWRKDGVMIFPNEFIPILEKTGAICELDFYVFDRVLRDLAEWKKAGIDTVCISSNFSKKHLNRRDFANRILSMMQKYGIEPDKVEIELTESLEADDTEALLSFLKIMKTNGVKTAIDDFGSGYSSLSLLKRMKMDTVKLDKSLVDDTGIGIRENDIIAANMIRLLNDLEVDVVAEGAETKEQIDFLREADCEIVQGFYFDKPLHREDFEKRLKNRIYIKDFENA